MSYDLIVIGGGLVGGAIAWGAAARGASVALLDQGDLAYRAARGNFGLVWVQSKGAGMPA
jgi:glycine/D-amino acid oxidase-like deaminating enzyme